MGRNLHRVSLCANPELFLTRTAGSLCTVASEFASDAIDGSDKGKCGMALSNPSAGFEPRIVAFLCNWCAYRAADLAGTSRFRYPPNVRAIRVMCTGSIDPVYVLQALLNGADGVLIAGCHLGNCHYQN